MRGTSSPVTAPAWLSCELQRHVDFVLRRLGNVT